MSGRNRKMSSLTDKLKSELRSELTGNILPFWINKATDHVHGGFLGHIDFDGRPQPKAVKGAILNARILWTFSAAYRVLKSEHYLEMARRAYTYFTNHFPDPEYGGVYWKLDFEGNPVETKKQVYALAFAIYGLTEYHRAVDDPAALNLARNLYRDIEQHSFDPERNGYFEAFSREWAPIDDLRLSEKDQNESKTMNTHLHILEAYTNLYRVWENDELRLKLVNLIRLFLEKFVNSESHLNLFFDDDWNLRSDLVSYGHDIECSWLLQEAAGVTGDPQLVEHTRELAVSIAEKNLEGFDNTGGLCYEFFPGEGRVDREKHWWPQAEAIVGYYNAYQVSGREKYLHIAVSTWHFIQKYLVDVANGEWHWSVDEYGTPNTKEEKAGFWKCPYHNSRACLEILER